MKILCLGDSLTYGYDVPVAQRWTTRVAAALGVTLQNEGVCGDTTAGMAYRLSFLPVAAYDAFFLMGGANDVLMDCDLAVTKANLAAMAETLGQTQKPVFLGIFPTTTAASAHFGWQRPGDVERHNQAIRDLGEFVNSLCREKGYYVVPFASVVNPDEETRSNCPLYADGVHPTAAGYERFAAVAGAVFKAVLAR